MTRDYNKIPINQIRRKDRQVDDAFVKDMLQRAPYCTIAHVAGKQPFLHTNTFYFDELGHCIYFHTAAEGRMRFNVEDNANVCLSVTEMGRLLPAPIALEFSVEYAGVMVFGHVEVISDTEEAKVWMQRLLDKYFSHLKPDRDYRSSTDKEIKRTAVYRIKIEKWSGKAKKVAADFPGAFHYGAHGGIQ